MLTIPPRFPGRRAPASRPRLKLLHTGLTALGGMSLALSCMAQELGIPQASDANRPASTTTSAASANNPAANVQAFVLTSVNLASNNALSVFSSTDGVTFTSLASEAFQPDQAAGSATLRDPAIVRHSDGYYYVVYATGSALALTRSQDLKRWQFVRDLPGIAGTPRWLRDKDGALKLVVASSTGNVQLLTANADLSQWSAPVTLAGLPAASDAVVVATDDGYAALVRDDKTGLLELATATALAGPWTVAPRGDRESWGRTAGGQSLVKLANGHWRAYFSDAVLGKLWYADSSDGLRTWTAKQELGGVSGLLGKTAVLAEDGKQFAAATRPKGQPKKISWDEHSMLVDGKRIVVWSGEIHPFRLPNPSLWRDVIQKMKALGFNGVAFYFDWGYHSSAPGVYDFSNVRNVERALDIADIGKIVHAGRRRVIAPVEIKGHAVEAERFHLLDHVAPQRRVGQAERVDFTGPHHDALAIDQHRMLVPADFFWLAFRPGGGSELLAVFRQHGGLAQQAGHAAQFLFRGPGAQTVAAVGVPQLAQDGIAKVRAPVAVGQLDQRLAAGRAAPALAVATGGNRPRPGQRGGGGQFQQAGLVIAHQRGIAVIGRHHHGIAGGGQAGERDRRRPLRQVGICRQQLHVACAGSDHELQCAILVAQPARRAGDAGQVAHELPAFQILRAGKGQCAAGGIHHVVIAVAVPHDGRIAQRGAASCLIGLERFRGQRCEGHAIGGRKHAQRIIRRQVDTGQHERLDVGGRVVGAGGRGGGRRGAVGIGGLGNTEFLRHAAERKRHAAKGGQAGMEQLQAGAGSGGATSGKAWWNSEHGPCI